MHLNLEDEGDERGQREQRRDDDGRVKKEFLRATARMIRCAPIIVPSECTSDRSPRLLKEDKGDKKHRERYLCVRKHRTYIHWRTLYQPLIFCAIPLQLTRGEPVRILLLA